MGQGRHVDGADVQVEMGIVLRRCSGWGKRGVRTTQCMCGQ